MNTKTGNRAQPNKMYSNVKGGRGWGGGLGWGVGVGGRGRGQARLFQVQFSVYREVYNYTHRILYRTVNSV